MLIMAPSGYEVASITGMVSVFLSGLQRKSKTLRQNSVQSFKNKQRLMKRLFEDKSVLAPPSTNFPRFYQMLTFQVPTGCSPA